MIRSLQRYLIRNTGLVANYSSQDINLERSDQTQTTGREGEFRVLDLKKNKAKGRAQRKAFTKHAVLPPRYLKLPEDNDWTNVWPGPRTFHPATVPVPVRQGYNKLGASPTKFGNAELMKIPNFLHLTPPAIKKHCEALKQFCSPWPTGLETDEKCEKHFPVEVITSDYCHSSPTIRDPLARIVTIKMKLSILKLNRHARDKFLRLVGDRYDEETDVLTIVTDRCPVRQQNYDYAMYLLTALFHESWLVEEWESEKSLDDMECFEWENNQSFKNVFQFLQAIDPQIDPNNLADEWRQKVQLYKQTMENIFNKDENEETLSQYKEAVKSILFPS